MPPPIPELSRDYEDGLDAAENAGRRGVSVWWFLIAMAGYLAWKVRS